jgi:hypothetical protein
MPFILVPVVRMMRQGRVSNPPHHPVARTGEVLEPAVEI